MYTDSHLRVSDAQAITGAGSVVSTSSVDLADATNPNREIADGLCKVRSHSVATTAFDSAADGASVAFEIITATDAALTTSIEVIGQSEPLGEALFDPVPGKQVVVEMNPDIGDLGQRYLGMRYIISGENLTAGAVTTDFVLEYADGRKFYPTSVVVS